MNECKKIASLPNDKRYKAYEDLVKNTVKKKDCKAIGEIVDHVLKVEGSDQHGRTYITLEILLLLIKLLSPKYVKNENDLIDIEDLLPLAEKIVPMLREKGDDFPMLSWRVLHCSLLFTRQSPNGRKRRFYYLALDLKTLGNAPPVPVKKWIGILMPQKPGWSVTKLDRPPNRLRKHMH